LIDCEDYSELPQNVKYVLSLIQRAKLAGILQGDLNYVQSTCLFIANEVETKRERKKLEDNKDFWLAFTKPEAFRYITQQRELRKIDKRNDVEITADTMEGLIQMMEEEGL
jgi:hypothetical protein